MAGGIDIKAVYTLKCDHCGVHADAKGVEYRSRVEAIEARRRVARYDGWLLRRIGPAVEFLCPECSALPRVTGGT